MENKLIRLFGEGKQALGMFSALNSVAAVECIGLSGLDFVAIDTEHGPADVESTLYAIAAAERRGITPIVRVKDPSRPSILKMLDIGAQGIIVPFIQSIDEVRRVVSYAKYAPTGSRGYGVTRACGYGTVKLGIEDYFAENNRETLLLPQCETAGCLHEIEAIAALDGVDGIFVGPYDLSIALGVPGKIQDETLLAGIKRVLNACRDAGKLAFIFAGDAKTARRYFDMGFDAVGCGVDTMCLTNAARAMAEEVKGQA